MVNIPGTSAGTESFSMDSLQEALGKQVTEGLQIDETLVELRKKNPDVFDAKLMQMRSDYQEFYDENAQIKLSELKERLNWHERMALLVSHYLGDNIFSLFFGGKSKRAKTMSFSNLKETFDQEVKKNPQGDKQVEGNNLLWLGTTNPISQLLVLFNFAGMFKEKSEKDEEPFPLAPQSRIIMGAAPASAGPKMTPTRFAIMKDICKSKGITLDMIPVGEVGAATKEPAKPAKDTIQVIFVPREGLPLGKDGKINGAELEWFQKIFDDGANNQWVLTAPLLAAIYVRKGMTVENALAKTGLTSIADQSFKDLLAGIEVPGKEQEAPPAPEDLLKDVKGADGKLDQEKLKTYHQKIKDGEGAWISPAEKAATQVLVEGAPVERALSTAGIDSTKPGYEQLKKDLESLAEAPAEEDASVDEEFPTSPV